jgi:hypothetical protein
MKIKGIEMATIKIDNQEYNIDSLSEEAKSQLTNLHFVDSELARLNAQLAVFNTARVSYANALKSALPAAAGETIKFS